jgi:N-acetylglucosaminyl-diphospho-decaprenol L-rhamnosyltransferase
VRSNTRGGATVGSSGTAPNCIVDVVVVAHNSQPYLRACVEELAYEAEINVTVVDNGSSDEGALDLRGLRVNLVSTSENGGYAAGCNVGWRLGSAPFVLFLNADTQIGAVSVRRLIAAMSNNGTAGATAPRLVGADGTVELSQRKFPRLRYTFAEALFLHRFTSAGWASDALRKKTDYQHRQSCEWVHGACLLVRRAVLEAVDGLDESFFHYCEDADLCYRIRQLGFETWFEPAVTALHIGGGSAARVDLLPRLTSSKILYAKKHCNPPTATFERLGLALKGLTHMIASSGLDRRASHAR